MMYYELDKYNKLQIDNDFTKFNNIDIKDFKFMITLNIKLLDNSITKRKEILKRNIIDIWDGDLMGDHKINYSKLSRYINL